MINLNIFAEGGRQLVLFAERSRQGRNEGELEKNPNIFSSNYDKNENQVSFNSLRPEVEQP